MPYNDNEEFDPMEELMNGLGNDDDPDTKNFADDMAFAIMYMLMKKIDKTGFMAHQAKMLRDNGMPVKNIPLYMKSIADWFKENGENAKKTIIADQFNRMMSDEAKTSGFDIDEFRRLMDNEMKDD